MSLDYLKLFPNSESSDFYINLPEPLNTNKAIFTLYGRNGLFGIGKRMLTNNSKKSTALLPAYSCGDEIESLSNAGYEIETYNIKPDLQLDLHDLKNKLSSKTGVVLITHYFGFPQQQIIEIKELLQKDEIYLIEDCAHTIGGQFLKKPLGITGDASIFSLRKFLPIPHGGALLINNPDLGKLQFDIPDNNAVNADLFVYLGLRNNFFKPGTSIKSIYSDLNIELPSQHGPRLPSFGGYNLGISTLAQKIISTTKIDNLLTNRVKLFQALLDFFKSKREFQNKLLFKELPIGVVPSFFPINVIDSEKVSNYLNKNGLYIAQPYWSYLHKHVNWKKYPEVQKLKKGILVIYLGRNIINSDLTKFALLCKELGL